MHRVSSSAQQLLASQEVLYCLELVIFNPYGNVFSEAEFLTTSTSRMKDTNMGTARIFKCLLLCTAYCSANSILNFLLLPYTQDLAIPNQHIPENQVTN